MSPNVMLGRRCRTCPQCGCRCVSLPTGTARATARRGVKRAERNAWRRDLIKTRRAPETITVGARG